AGDRRASHARRDAAAADPGGTPDRRDRDPRPARPQARRPRRELLAISPLHLGRAGPPGGLAAFGTRRPSLCARAGMGGGTHGLDLARPLALDDVPLEARAGAQT